MRKGEGDDRDGREGNRDGKRERERERQGWERKIERDNSGRERDR